MYAIISSKYYYKAYIFSAQMNHASDSLIYTCNSTKVLGALLFHSYIRIEQENVLISCSFALNLLCLVKMYHFDGGKVISNSTHP